jgi:hypothetical protein
MTYFGLLLGDRVVFRSGVDVIEAGALVLVPLEPGKYGCDGDHARALQYSGRPCLADRSTLHTHGATQIDHVLDKHLARTGVQLIAAADE